MEIKRAKLCYAIKMAIEKLNKTYVNNQTKLNAEDFQENVDKIDEIIDNIKPYILFEGKENGDIQLNENIENFFKIDIVTLKSGENLLKTFSFYTPISGYALNIDFGFAQQYQNGNIIQCFKSYSASGNMITRHTQYGGKTLQLEINTSSGAHNFVDKNDIYILKVIGYKNS